MKKRRKSKSRLPRGFKKIKFIDLMWASNDPRVKKRLLAMLNLQIGAGFADIAESAGVSVSTVRRWFSQFKKRGIEGLGGASESEHAEAPGESTTRE